MPRPSPLIFIALLLGLAGGCSKAGASSAYPDAAAPPEMAGGYPAEEAAPGYSGGEGDYAADGVAVEREMSDAEPMADTASTTIASPAPQTGKGSPQPAIAEPDQPDDHGRQIIYTANMQIGVYNVQKAMEIAEALPARLGGWVHARSEGFLTMKIPARHLAGAMDELGKLGNVVARELQAQDVTAEYVDLETRIRVLRETQEQLLELLKRSKTVEEALNVRRALDDVTMQLETSLGRMRQLQGQISFSTLTLALIEQGPHTDTPSSNDPFPWVDSLGVEATEWR